MHPLVLIVILMAVTIAILVYGLYQVTTRRRVILAQRVETYAGIEEEAALAAKAELQQVSPTARLLRLFFGRGYLERIENDLLRADIPLRPSEYVLLRVVLAGAAFLFGRFALGYLHSGLCLAVLGFFIPAMFVRAYQSRRRAKFTRQLANALMLLTNSLRSGYSFLKGLEMIAKEMDDPIAKELNRMLREVSLGASIEDGLLNMGRRVNSQDLDIVISAYLVQKDVGGNLTEIMEKVAETIRERLRIQGDVKVLTAQGRLSGLIVGLLPVFVFLFIFFTNPSFYSVMLDRTVGSPIAGLPFGVVLSAGGILLELVGAYLIMKIVTIKV